MKAKLPRLAIIGYGTMGHEIEKAALSNGFEVVAKYDIDNPVVEETKFDFDVAIDFSIGRAVYDNACILARNGKNFVIGATGWYDSLELVTNIVKKYDVGMLWSPNFSIGMNIFMKIVQVASKLINLAPGYDIFIVETHHKRKKDAPSGTAISLGEIILREFKHKDQLLFGNPEGAILPEMLQISSIRAGDYLGKHTVTIDSPVDTIELTHNAKNREGFAAGALLAASWIQGKKGVFKFDDILDQIWFAERE
ncbi:MAG: 4-hydroxy-tetrahydrodipicolinate reductase [Bacteroidota bacterium]